MRRGLITSIGTKKHDKIVSSVIKFLIKKCDASPLRINTEVEFRLKNGKRTYIDIVWNGKLIECITSVSSLSGKKLEALVELKKPLILAGPKDLDIKFISGRLLPYLKGVLLFDIEKEELYKAFKDFNEYIAFVLLNKKGKTLDIDF